MFETKVNLNSNEVEDLETIEDFEDELLHYGMPRRSGRYPWGSGDSPYQHSGDFLARVKQLESENLSEKEIADIMGLSTTRLRACKSIATNERRRDLVAKAKSLASDGVGATEGARILGLAGESSFRALLKEDSEVRMDKSLNTAKKLKEIVDAKGMVDVGIGCERQLGISKEKLNIALDMLAMEGYEVYGNRVPQATQKGQYTIQKVLCKPGTPHKDTYQFDKIYSITDITSDDGGETFREDKFIYPPSLSSKRVQIRYDEDGGTAKDGLVEIRPSAKDLSLGNSTYAQVRVLVDDKYYIKGMACYGPEKDFPPGVDIIVNSNKKREKGLEGALKEIKHDDPDNPFGATVRNTYFADPKTGEKTMSVINKKTDQGEWNDWSNHLPAQFLSKQPMDLMKKQINLAISDKNDEYAEINTITNPTLKRKMLLSFAEDCDSAAVSLHAASLPGQAYKVILPLKTIKDNEVYAPHLPDGSEVALIRYPHGGLFEIPILKVNNGNQEGQTYLGNRPTDAIGINKNTADILSGADFDGDTVMCIPLNKSVKVSNQNQLKDLVGFDTKLAYQYDKTSFKDENGVMHYCRAGKEFQTMSKQNTGMEMGKVSNLITDMTLKGASEEELARAVKHSMVVIDAEKHKLDYRKSEIDNGIKALKNKYQKQSTDIDENGNVIDKDHGGAATLISKAKSPMDVRERKEGGLFTRANNEPVEIVGYDDFKQPIYSNTVTGEILPKSQVKTVPFDPETGEKLYHLTNRTYPKIRIKSKEYAVVQKDGKFFAKINGEYQQVDPNEIFQKPALDKVAKMEIVKDARALSSGTPQEELYAYYANYLKSLANQARKQTVMIEDIPSTPAARKMYATEIESLDRKINDSELNAPKERLAQRIAAANIKARMEDNPQLDKEHEKKMRQREIANARAKVGAHRVQIDLTDKEWEAIQAGAVSVSKLNAIFKYADDAKLKQLAMPRTDKSRLSESKIRRIESMASSGYTIAEIAKTTGVSASTILAYTNPNKEK